MPNGIATLFENASPQDLDDVYLQYSERFLSDADKARIQEIDDETKSLELRANILCDKDPFSPPKNSLDMSLRLVDPQKVLRSFKQGYNEYKLITQQEKSSLEPARLYKLGLFKESTTEDLKQFHGIHNDLNYLKSEEDFEKLLNRLSRTNVIKALNVEKTAIFKAKSNKTPASQQAALKQVLSRVQKIIKKYGECDLFKSDKDHQTLKHCGAVYDIGDDAHSWGTNLSWALGHIRQGNKFIVCADILANQYRGAYQDTPCAFARELCVALKAGYTLHVNSSHEVTLSPNGLTSEYLQKLDSTGELGDEVNPTFEEVNLIFTALSQKFSCKPPFKYKFDSQLQLNTAMHTDDMLSSTATLAQRSLSAEMAALDTRKPEDFGEHPANKKQKVEKVNVVDTTEKSTPPSSPSRGPSPPRPSSLGIR